LTQAGFQFLGEWTGNPDGTILLHAPAPSAPGVYAFVVDDVVVYVGLTLSGLRIRFDQYRRGHEGQRTSARINDRIAQTLLKGKRVKVLVATPEPLEWQELPVNTAAGLEAGLIEMIRPSWNIKGAR
jgi:excinuclease UvrABC nuclease subunit